MEALTYLVQIFGLSFTSGVNLYATVGLVGLAIRFGWVTNLPSQLDFMANEYVIGTAIFMYACEFIADKIPAFDTFWDSIHTFIRPFAAAMIALMAAGDAPMTIKIIAFMLAGSIALTSHTAKAGVRLIANTSPEPFSNSILSIAEDLGVFLLVTLVITHPYVAAIIITLLLILIIWQGPKLLGFALFMFKAVIAKTLSYLPDKNYINIESMPAKFNLYLDSILKEGEKIYLICNMTFKGLHKGAGYLVVSADSLIIIYSKWFKIRHIDLDPSQIKKMTFNIGFLTDKITFMYLDKKYTLTFFKCRNRSLNDIRNIIRALKVDIVEAELLTKGLAPGAA